MYISFALNSITVAENDSKYAITRILDSKPPGTNCRARYSSAKGCRSYFSADVVTAVHIGMDNLPVSRLIPTACNPFPAKRRWLRLFWIVGGNVVQVKKSSFGRVAFFVGHHLNAHERPFVLHHLKKTGVRHLHKLLVVLLTHLDFLFPERVFPNTKRSDSLAYHNRGEACHRNGYVLRTMPGLIRHHLRRSKGQAEYSQHSL